MKSSVIRTKSALILLLCGVTVFSCRKSEFPQYTYDATFYMGVNLSDAACIYKDSQMLYKLDSNSFVTGLAVMSDGIYACGEILNFNDDWKQTTATPAIWKDGKRLEKDFGTGEYSGFGNMVIRDGKWLCCGTLADEAGIPYGVIIENGETVFRSDSGTHFQCMDCGVSGDCYVVASSDGDIILCRISSEKWKVTSTEVIATNSEEYSWSANCIYVGTSDIAVGLDRFRPSVPETAAFCWLNAGTGLRCLEDKSSVYDITFFRGFLVAGGCNETITTTADNMEFHDTAVQWVNGASQDFSYGCKGNSEVSLVMGWNNMFIFQCVQHEGGIQICNDGGLLRAISTPEKPVVTCWDAEIREVLK